MSDMTYDEYTRLLNEQDKRARQARLAGEFGIYKEACDETHRLVCKWARTHPTPSRYLR